MSGPHLLSIADLGREGIEEVLRVTDAFVEVSGRAIPKVPALRGKTVQVGCAGVRTPQKAKGVAAHLIGDQQHHIQRLVRKLRSGAERRGGCKETSQGGATGRSVVLFWHS